MKITRNDFPKTFQFGAATAAYQIEGSSFGGAGPSHWDTFARTPGNVVGNHDGSIACEHYQRYEEDLDLLRDAGFDTYRFSTSWSRIMPEGRGQVNQQGLDFYDRLVDGMLERGLKPYQTLYHWEMPAALSDIGGWTNRDVAGWFGDFTEVIMERLGDRIEAVGTINEPWCVAYLSHFLGKHAPGMRDIRATARAMHHVLLAHGEAMIRLRARGQKNCGIVLNFEYKQAASHTPEDVAACATEHALYNRWYIEGVTKGAYPKEALAGLEQHLPSNWQDDMALISQPIDWLGVNYYTRHIIQANPGAPWPATANKKGHLTTTQLNWEIYPDGLQHFLTWLSETYVGDLPMFVTENGMAWDDNMENGSVHDPVRIEYIEQHLYAIKNSISQGANVKGFFYWSLLDNYEWAEGYKPRFGLVHVDYETQKRTPKASYHMLKDAISRDQST